MGKLQAKGMRCIKYIDCTVKGIFFSLFPF